MTTDYTQLPEEFIRRITKLLGEEESGLFLSSITRPDDVAQTHKALRLNCLKDSTARLLRIMPSEWALRRVLWTDNGFYYNADMRPGRHPLHEMGLYYIQEPSAMAPAALSGTCPGERVLDLCAAPGGKSTQLAAMLEGKGVLVSNEIHPARAKILSQNMERMGVVNAVVTSESPEKLSQAFPFFFDRIVVDAPCSGEGMFRKEEQALSMWSVDNILACAARQAGILDAAASMLKAGGTMVYSTCTFAPEENEENIAAFLLRHPEFSLTDLPAKLGPSMEEWGFSHGIMPDPSGTGIPDAEDIRRLCRDRTVRLWPHRLEGEGHFVAVLRKTGGTDPTALQRDAGLRAVRDRRAGAHGKSAGAAKEKEAVLLYDAFASACLKHRPDSTDTTSEMVLFGEELYLMPAGIRTAGLRILRAGLHLGSVKKDRFEPAHALARALGPEDVNSAYELASKEEQEGVPDRAPGEASLQRAAAYLRGESIACDMSARGWTLVTLCGYSLGWAKASGGMLKNHYPKGLRMIGA